MSEETKELCPFSFGFAVPVRSGIDLVSGAKTRDIQVGLPCAGENCKLYYRAKGMCIFFEISLTLNAVLEKLNGLV